MKTLQTAERVSHIDTSDNYVYQRSVLAYLEAAKIISGKVLEIGTGMGYGLEIVAPAADEFVTIDKYKPEIDITQYTNVEFRQMTVPPLTGIADNTFDYVVTFQVIEHIEDDHAFVKEIQRVLKKGGKLICTTPNKKMSLARNPWHVREYYVDGLKNMMLKYYDNVDTKGVYGNEKVMEYFENNKKAVNKIMRFDIFNLQWILPRSILQIPYDYLNRRNRRKLEQQDNTLLNSITTGDYFVKQADETCLDLFYIAQK